MIIEKTIKTEELLIQVEKIIEMIEDPKDKIEIFEIIENIIAPIVGVEKASKMLEQINKKEVDNMSPLMKLTLDVYNQKRQEGRKEEKKQIIIQMLKNNIADELIRKIAEVSEKELSEIKRECPIG